MLTPDNKTPPIRLSQNKETDLESKTFEVERTDKPKDPPNSEVAFREVLDKKKKGSKDPQSDTKKDDSLGQQVSIFDISSKATDKVAKAPPPEIKPDIKTNVVQPQVPKESPSQVYGRMIKEPGVEESKIPQFAQEQPDLSYINPGAVAHSALGIDMPVTASPKAPPVIAAQLQEAIDQIVDKLYTLRVNGQVDTVLVLKHPPMFEGVSVVVSAFDNAKGEFNIAFHNLTQAAKQVLDAQNNQALLRHALEEKGYLVHIVVMSTNPIETRAPNETAYGSRQDKGSKEEQQGRGEQGKR